MKRKGFPDQENSVNYKPCLFKVNYIDKEYTFQNLPQSTPIHTKVNFELPKIEKPKELIFKYIFSNPTEKPPSDFIPTEVAKKYTFSLG